MVLWGCPAPRGYLSVSSVRLEEHSIKWPVPQPPGGPLLGPAQPPVHLPNQGEGLPPQRIQDRAPVPVPGPGSLCPSRRLPLAAPVLAAPMPRPAPPPAEVIRAGSALGAGGAAGWCWGRGGWGGTSSPCCRGGGGGGGGGCGAPASVGCRGGCTSPAARPGAGAPRPPPPSLWPALPPPAPMPHLVCPLGPMAPLLSPLGPLPAPCRCRGSCPLSPTPWPARSPTVPRPAPCTWAPCPRPCAPFPCPGPFPTPCPESRRLHSRRGGGWLVLGSWGVGGHELAML